MKKQLLCAILCLVMVVTLLVVGAGAQQPDHENQTTYTKCGHGTETWIKWESKNTLPTDGGHYYLTQDVTLSAVTGTTYDKGNNVVICLNGKNITTSSSNGRLLTIKSGSLTFCDCTAHTETAVVDGESVEVYVAGRLYGGNRDPGVAHISGTGKLVLQDGILTGNTSGSKANSGMITLEKGAFHMHGGRITGNTMGHNDNGGMVCTYADFTMTGGSIGGAIFADDGTTVITGNTGRGVSVRATGAVFTMSGGEITGNYTTKNGGGICITNGAVNLSGNAKITNNTGAVGGGLEHASGTVSISGNVLISGNTATSVGGGIRIKAGKTLTMTGGTIAGNHAAGDGGGVSNYGIFNMSGGTISDNTTDKNGGGIIVAGGAVVNLTGGSVTGNSAVSGGGILLQGANPQVLLKDVQITGNTATTYAGGVYVGYKVDTDDVKELTVSGKTVVTGNTAGGAKANVHLMSADRVIYQDALDTGAQIGVRKVSGTEIIRSGATEETVGCYISDAPGRILVCQEGGGYLAVAPSAEHKPHETDECGHESVTWTEWASEIVLPTDSGHYYLVADVTLSDVWTVRSGKEITLCLNGYSIIQSADSKQVINIDGGQLSICDCTAYTDAQVYGAGWITGGTQAVHISNNGGFALYDGVLTGNDSSAVAVEAGQFRMKGGRITGNTAENSKSGAVCVTGIFTMTGGSIGGPTFSADGATAISGNTGRGVWVSGENALFTMTGGEITGNTTANNGGGICMNSGTVNLSGDAKITGNTSAVGGGIEQAGGTLHISENAVISDNTATSVGGGIRVKSNLTLTMTGGTVTGNHAAGDGGGVSVYGTLNMSGGKITDNTTDKNGGGIIAAGGSVVNLTGGSITGNSAVNGGGMMIQGANPQVLLKDVQITGNTATTNAGGVYVGYKVDTDDVREVTVSGKTVITDNTAGGVKANLHLMSVDRVIYQDALDTGAQIGVRKIGGAEIVRSGATQETVSCYSSDALGRNVERRGESLYLALDPSAAHDPHDTDECGHDSVTWTEWSSDMSLPTNSGHYYLIADVNIRGAWDVKGGKEITICLNGYSITQTKAGHRVLRIEDSTVNICDCQAHSKNGVYTAGKLTGGSTGESAGAGAVMMAGKSTLRLYDGMITGNHTDGTGTIVVSANSVFEMHGGRISCNTVGESGGGAYVSGQFLMTGGAIEKNTSQGANGGVNLTLGTMTMTGGSINGNAATSSAGIGVIGGKLILKDGRISGNEARTGGGGGIGTKAHSGGTEASVLISGGEISHNTSKMDGAGIRVDSGKLEITGGLITENEAIGCAGGGMMLGGQEAIISGGVITGNKGKNAAGVLVKSPLTMTGGEISNNTSTSSGGGLHISKATVTVSGGTISGNTSGGDGAGVLVSGGTLNLEGGVITGNTTKHMAAGVWLINESVLNMSGGEVSKNKSTKSGAGIMIQSGSFAELTGGSVEYNKTENHGGGVYINQGCTAIIRGVHIIGNTAAKNGGGIYVSVNATMQLRKGYIHGNSARYGGGMALFGDTMISGSTVYANTSVREGGGAYISDAKVTMYGGEFDANSTAYNGGGICVRGTKGVFVLRDGKISNNTCAEQAGGILVQGGGKMFMYGGKVIGNIARSNGGGILATKCPVEIYGGQINDNVCNGTGAGIYSNMSLIIKDAELCGNTIKNEQGIATRAGAAIKVHNESVLVVENTLISGNSVDGRAGAIDVAYHVNAKITGCTITNNSATEKGGALSVYREAEAYLTDCVLSGNSCDANGGAFSLDAFGTITMKNCTVEGNSANQGGVGYGNTKTRTVFDGCTVTGNTAKTHASVLWANGDVVLKDTTVTGNTDQKGGAAICMDNTDADTESYLPGVFELIGAVSVCDNTGGELVLCNNAYLNVHGDGLGENSRILINLQDEEITRWVAGPYNYQKDGELFVLTRGEQSLAEVFAPKPTEPDEPQPTEPQPTEPRPTEPQTQPTASEPAPTAPAGEDKESPVTGVIIGAAALLAVAAVAVVIGRKKRSGKTT